ncbi:MAG: metallophosphoesterase [Salinibacter sp.]
MPRSIVAMTIAHLSDLHFGRIADTGIVDALVAEINDRADDLVVLSGDLTQRARHREFEAAQAMLRRLEPSTLAVPGNHDVYPWWRPVRRLATPLRRYKRYVTGDLAPTHAADGVAVLGISTAYGATIKGGRVGPGDRRAIRDYFEDVSDAAFRILVLHHHLTEVRSIGPHDVARQARRTLDTAAEQGVHLILCGHLHVSHVEPLKVIPGAQRMVVASAGTATSNRWRPSFRPTNVYNIVTVTEDAFQIEERRYRSDEARFVPERRTRFDRTPPPMPDEAG